MSDYLGNLVARFSAPTAVIKLPGCHRSSSPRDYLKAFCRLKWIEKFKPWRLSRRFRVWTPWRFHR